MPSELIDKWPSTLKTQLAISQSHLTLVDLVGPSKAFIGIFEIFSRTPLPPGTKPVMSKVPSSGSQELEPRFGKPGESSYLSGYAFVVVVKALDEFPQNYRTGSQVKKLIHECMHETLKFDTLVHDIATAARTLARLNLSRTLNESKPVEKVKTLDIDLKRILEFESLTDRPQDWKSSHWWTGE
jgi:hypothetical protein